VRGLVVLRPLHAEVRPAEVIGQDKHNVRARGIGRRRRIAERSDLLRLQQAIKSGKQKKADSAKVELLLEDGTIYPEKGSLKFTDLAVDPNTGSVQLRAEFPNPRHELLPGTFVRIRFPQAQLDEAIRVPQRAVSTSAQGQSVMVVDAEGKVSPRPIRTGGMAGPDFIIADGLKSGEQVIVNGLQKARPGATVKPVPWTPGAPLLPPPQSAKLAELKPEEKK